MPLRFVDPAADYHRIPLTIRHLLNGVVAKAGEQRIIYRDQADISYAEFVGRIGRLATLLAAAGTGPGTTVAVMDWDSHRYLESYFAVPMMGAVLQTVNIRLPQPQIAYTLQHADAEIILVHRDFFPIIDAIRHQLPRVKAIIAIMDGADDPLPPWAIGEYEMLSDASPPDYPFEDFDENAVATTFYTSGTTGNPKGVCFTHRQLVLHTLAICAPFGASDAAPWIGVGDVYMPLTPMFHVHAWGFPYIATMLGLKQVYPGRYDPQAICTLRNQHGISYSHCVPTVLEMLLNAAEAIGADLSGWKVTIGGSALTQSLLARAEARGMALGAAYGMSESCPVVAVAGRRGTPRDMDGGGDDHVLTRAGISAPLVDIAIVDDDLNPLLHDGQSRGEVVLRSPWLTAQYVGDGSATDTLWRGGWMHTQDVGTIDPSGQLQIRDRLKDVIKTGGEWIDSLQLEQIVATGSAVAEAAVIAVPDAKWGERPLAVIRPAPDATPTLASINAPVDAAIAEGLITRYARLDQFALVDHLPRTSVGKIDKKLLRARFAEGQAQ